MDRKRMSADDEKPHLMREKGGQEVAKILVHEFSRTPARATP
jgi:hypothetical protein